MRSAGSPYTVFQRALNGNLCVAEAGARDLHHVSLEDALLRLVHLHAERESPKYKRAAMKWLRRYLHEKEPTLKNFATVVRSLDERAQ